MFSHAPEFLPCLPSVPRNLAECAVIHRLITKILVINI